MTQKETRDDGLLKGSLCTHLMRCSSSWSASTTPKLFKVFLVSSLISLCSFFFAADARISSLLSGVNKLMLLTRSTTRATSQGASPRQARVVPTSNDMHHFSSSAHFLLILGIIHLQNSSTSGNHLLFYNSNFQFQKELISVSIERLEPYMYF